MASSSEVFKVSQPIAKNNEKAGTVTRYQAYNVDDIVWAKMKGFPLWPAKVGLEFLLKNFFQKIFNDNFF